MKKNGVLLGFFVLIFILPFAIAANETIESKAISCIQDQINTKGCSTFGLDDKIFALLSTKSCKNELISVDSNDECFGNNGCTITTTSQAVLALSEAGSATDNYVNWILSQNMTVPGLDWLLQIESPEATSCSIIDLNDNTYQVSIAEDKKLTLANTLNCLTLDEGGYWLKIKPSCYNQEFEITCDQSFQTSFLFKKGISQTIYVLDEVEQSAGGGTTVTKQISSNCFKQGTSCDYESTLWATLVLKKLGYDVSSYLSYLIAFEEDNEGLLPESFLYYLTGERDFLNQLIFKQKGNKYWDEAHDRYYDTAVALLTLSSESFDEKDNTLNWLGETQDANGCWNSGSVASTGFLLYSLWPKSVGGEETSEDCEDLGNYCISDIECTEASGSILGYDCFGFNDVCCDKDKLATTCSSLQGEICDSTQDCDGQIDYTAAGVGLDEICCLGYCQEKTQVPTESACSQNFGTCRDYGCNDGEKELTYECDYSSQSCCTPETKNRSLWWVWLLIILIVLTGLAIVFRDKLKDFYMKYKMKKSKGPPRGPPGRRPRMPPVGMPQRRPGPPRKILPLRGPPRRRPPAPAQRKPKEIDDVLKKLKEMGK